LAAAEGQAQLTAELVAMTAVGWFGRAADSPAAAVAVEPATPAIPTPVSPARPQQAAPSRGPLTDADATDIVGVATMDVPVLTDIFEEPPAAQKPATSIAATAPTASKPPTTGDSADADELRQTRTMRAISVAESLDDISHSMAEALFGDADLDMLTAALAAEWPEESGTNTANSTPPAKETETPKAMTPSDDLFDSLNLGRDGPLELGGDAKPPQSQQPRKTATQR
ncbi:MAG TPA: hypothetical protein VFB99_25350, partial [Vicinamibacterales bacterium]|nr:hypothetical protein [Vicinamibacterales bacterium]